MTDTESTEHPRQSLANDESAVDPILRELANNASKEECLKSLDDWPGLKSRIKERFQAIQQQVRDEEITNKARPLIEDIESHIDEMNEAPWTIQRLCELLADPELNYQDYFKFLRALQKTVFVTSGYKRFHQTLGVRDLTDRRISPFQKHNAPSKDYTDDDDSDHVVPLRTRIPPLQERPVSAKYMGSAEREEEELVILRSPQADPIPEQPQVRQPDPMELE